MHCTEQLPGEPTCPHCGQVNDGFTPATGAPAPCNGDLSICTGCASFSIFVLRGDLWSLRTLRGDEAQEVRSDPEAMRIQSIVRKRFLS